MPIFFYKAKNKPDNIIEGRLEADNRDAAIAKLNRMGYFPLDVNEERPQEDKKKGGPSLHLFHKISPQDTGLFTRQLSDLLDSGLTLLRSLEVIYNQTHNIHLKEIVLQLHDFVRDGGSFSEALRRHPRVFSGLYVNMVKTGELSGTLDKVLHRLADFSESEQDVRSKIKMSLAYPVLMVILGIVTVFVLLTFVIPRLVVMFVDLGQSLPLPTLLLINVSAFFARFWWLVIISVGLIYLYFKRMHVSSEGKVILDKFKLKIPVFGDFITKVEIARFGRTLGTLLDSGVTIIESMQTVAYVLGNEVLRRDVQRMSEEIADGSSLTSTMQKSPLFPEVVVNMVAVGEESGQLEKSLIKIAESYERESDRLVKLITTLLEPAAILVIGAVVGFIVVAMLLPIFQMNLIMY